MPSSPSLGTTRERVQRPHSSVVWAALDNTENRRLAGRERHVVGHYRLGQALQGKLADFFERHSLFDSNSNALTGEYLSVLRLGAKPSGQVADRPDRTVAPTFGKPDPAQRRKSFCVRSVDFRGVSA